MKSETHKAPKAKTYRRQLRQTTTKPEQLIWAVLRNRRLEDLKFRRQESIGHFIADFVCSELKLIIELDGGYHDDVLEADQNRHRFLENAGYRVIRFANEDVLEDVEAVAMAIRQIVAEIREKMRTD